MSTLANHSHVLAVVPSSAAAGVRWIDLATAASRSGMSVKHLSRLCGDHWFGRGLAKMEAPPEGGKRRWVVRDDADERLALVVMPERMALDLRKLSAVQRQRVFLREQVLNEWYAARRVGMSAGQNEQQATDAFLDRVEAERKLTVSRRTLHRWHAQYRDAGRAGLLDGRGHESNGGDGPGDADDQFLATVRALYFQPEKPSVRACWFAAKQKAIDNGWPYKEYRTTARYVTTLSGRAKVKYREGSKAFTAKCEPSIERDYSTLHTNEQWVGDHHQFDVVVMVNGKPVRPWLTAWMDMRSRRVVGWCIYGHDPNQNSILSALRIGIMEHGIPSLLYVDNGKDFDSYAFHGRTKWERRRGRVQIDPAHTRGILGNLGCDARFCWAYHGQSKPIERWFRTVEDRFGKTWPTYCGNKPENRPDQHEARVSRGEAPTLTEFVEAFGEWIEVDYHAAPHTGDGMNGFSPVQIFDASWNGHAKRTTTRDMLDLLLSKPTKPVKVTKRGVRWNGLYYGQFDLVLIANWWGKEVYVRVDERDITNVQVWSPDDRFICLAPSNERLPANATEQQLRPVIAEKKRVSRLDREHRQSRMKIGASLGDLMTRAAAEQHARTLPPTPPDAPRGPASITPHRSPLEADLSALQRATDAVQASGRIAVGAESSMSLRFVYSAPAASGPIDDDAPPQPFRYLMNSDAREEGQ